VTFWSSPGFVYLLKWDSFIGVASRDDHTAD
jgi:hypothetical protein